MGHPVWESPSHFSYRARHMSLWDSVNRLESRTGVTNPSESPRGTYYTNSSGEYTYYYVSIDNSTVLQFSIVVAAVCMRIHFVRLQLTSSCTVPGETTEKRSGSEGD